MPRMKALVYTAPERMEMEEREVPRPRAGEALLRVQATGICGSDISGFRGHQARRKPPLILGHEVVGVIEEINSDAFRPGQRVCANPLFYCYRCENCLNGRHSVCMDWRLLGMDDVQGAYADYVCAPVQALFPVPDTLPDEAAALPEPVACGIHLLGQRTRNDFGTLAIFGAGTQGILILSLARNLGYHEIYISDVNPQRLEVATKLGVTQAIHASEANARDTILALTGSIGVDVAIDAVGISRTRQDAAAVCKPGGEVLLLGLAEPASELELVPLIRKEVRILPSFAYNVNDFRKAVDLVVKGAIDIRNWTESRPLEEGQAAFEKMMHAPGGTVKTILKP